MNDNMSVVRLPRLDFVERLLARVRRTILGKNRWGYVDATALNRGGWFRERLTVLPPGTNDSERAALAFYKAWPVVGAVVALLAMVPLGALVPPGVAFAATFGVYAAAIYLSARATKQLRAASVVLVVLTIPLVGGLRSYGNVTKMADVRDALTSLDSRAGLTGPQYESEWAAIYWRLDAERDATRRELEQAILVLEH